MAKSENDQKDTGPEMIKCPECDLKLPKDDTDAQVAHMNANHPGLIAERLKQR